MPMRKTIICLANSRKHNGRCIAGVEVAEGQLADWVRPVSERPGAEVSEFERRYDNGSDPKVLDIISVPLSRAAPDGYQRENWILEPQHYWRRKGSILWQDLESLESDYAPLWPSQCESTYHGLHDRVTHREADRFDHSLRLIHVDEFRLQVLAPGAAFGNPKRRVLGWFMYQGMEYRLWVTDPVIERQFLAEPNGEYELGESYLTLSLGERAEDGYCYKLIAAVITPDRAVEGA